MSKDKLAFFDYDLFQGTLEQIDFSTDLKQVIINTINPHSFFVADHDDRFKSALKSSSFLLPDGIGIVYANLLINFFLVKKIAGIDLFYYLLQNAEKAGDAKCKRVFFLGSTDGVLKLIKEKISHDFPSLEVGTFSPPYKEDFSVVDNQKMIAEINAFNPYILFIGMTAPKQEKWVWEQKDSIHAVFLCSVGAVFDFYSGRIKRPGKFWRALGVEWLVRFSREPRRLWKRSIISLPYFIGKVLKESTKRIFARQFSQE